MPIQTADIFQWCLAAARREAVHLPPYKGTTRLLHFPSFWPRGEPCVLNWTSQWTFLFFLFLFELGSLVCGVAKSSSVLIGGRAIAGAGAAGLTNGGLTIISVAVPLEKRPR